MELKNISDVEKKIKEFKVTDYKLEFKMHTNGEF